LRTTPRTIRTSSQQLHSFLLRSGEWDAVSLFQFRALLDDIYAHWRNTTSQQPFPKLHMLWHAVEFAERHRILGAASEAQMESFHFRFNHLWNQQHRNMAQQPLVRIRRCLADAVTAAAAPFAEAEMAPAAETLLALAESPRHSQRLAAA
jgi:hypothetical protein